MPTILELFKQANANRDVTVWDGTTQKSGIIDRVRDVASAELDPNGIRVNFYKSIVTPPFIYGLETPRITTKGGVDPVRTLSVNSTRYNGPLKDGSQSTNNTKITIGSLLGGSANRPSDTIFDSETGAPITKGKLGGGPGDYNALKYAIDPGKKDYYVSQYPSDKPAFAGALKKNPVAALLNEGKSQLGNIVSKKIAKIRGSKKDTPQANEREIVYTNKNKYSTIDELKGRKFDTFNSTSLDLADWNGKGKDNVASTYFKTTEDKNTPYVYFEKYGVSNNTFRILLPAVVSGISEEVSPDWSSYKFIGSPFNSYRFQGVERSLSFEMKLYYETTTQRETMINNLNLLRKSSFPSQNIVATQYPTTNGANGNSPTNPYTPLSFTGNLMYLTINGLYYKLLGYIEKLSISIDDNTSWASSNVKNNGGILDKPYPSVINVSIGMKLIENPSVQSTGSGYTYDYNNYFTGDTSQNIK